MLLPSESAAIKGCL